MEKSRKLQTLLYTAHVSDYSVNVRDLNDTVGTPGKAF
jgi:hypothetical protein